MKTITITITEEPNGGVKLWCESKKTDCTRQEMISFLDLQPHLVAWMREAGKKAEYASPTMEVTGEHAPELVEGFLSKARTELEQHKRNKDQ